MDYRGRTGYDIAVGNKRVDVLHTLGAPPPPCHTQTNHVASEPSSQPTNQPPSNTNTPHHPTEREQPARVPAFA